MRLACVEIVTRGCPRSAGSGRAAGAGCVYPSGITAMCLCRRAQLRRCKHADGRAGVCTSISCWLLPHAGGTRAVPDLPERHLSSVRNNGLVLRLQLGRAETRLKATANIGYGWGGDVRNSSGETPLTGHVGTAGGSTRLCSTQVCSTTVAGHL